MSRPGFARKILILFVILGIMAAYFIFSSLRANADILSSVQNEQVTDVPTFDTEGKTASVTAGVVFPQATQDGQAIIIKRCTPCHVNTSFELIEKTQAEWEGTLTLMEAMGLQISQDEKSLLLKYLSQP